MPATMPTHAPTGPLSAPNSLASPCRRLHPACSARYNPVYQFRCNVAELGPAEMVMTSVAGHLLELDFVHPYNRWNGCEARQLYDVPVAKKVNEVGGGL